MRPRWPADPAATPACRRHQVLAACPSSQCPLPWQIPCWRADIDLTGSGDEFGVEEIEESSSEDERPLASRAAVAPRPPSVSRRPSAVAAAAAAAAGGAVAAARAAAPSGRIDAFLQRLPRGTPSAAALAGGGGGQGRQQAGALASRPATAEEQQLDLLDYANLMVGVQGDGIRGCRTLVHGCTGEELAWGQAVGSKCAKVGGCEWTMCKGACSAQDG